MTALAGCGQRNAALAQYQVCRRRLVRELGLEPSPETTALYEQIQADVLKQTKKPPAVWVLGPGEMVGGKIERKLINQFDQFFGVFPSVGAEKLTFYNLSKLDEFNSDF